MNRKHIAKTNLIALLSCITAISATTAQGQIFSFPRRGASAPSTAPTPIQVAPQAVAAPPLGPKQPGKIRIGVLSPKADLGDGFKGPNASEPVRATLIASLSGPAVEVTSLTSRIPQQIEMEAKEKECDFLLYSGITEKHSSGGGLGSMLVKAAPLASMIPMVGMGAGIGVMMSGAIAGQMASTAMLSAASLASGVKAKDDVTFEYRLVAPGAPTPLLAKTDKLKASRNGEDVITPLIERASGAIVAAATAAKK